MPNLRYGTVIDRLKEGTSAYNDFTEQMGNQPPPPPEQPPLEEEPSIWEKIFMPFSPKVQAWNRRQMPIPSDMVTAPEPEPPSLTERTIPERVGAGFGALGEDILSKIATGAQTYQDITGKISELPGVKQVKEFTKPFEQFIESPEVQTAAQVVPGFWGVGAGAGLVGMVKKGGLGKIPKKVPKVPEAAIPKAEAGMTPEQAREVLGIARNNKGYRDLVEQAKLEAENPRLRKRPATERLAEIDRQDIAEAQAKLSVKPTTPIPEAKPTTTPSTAVAGQGVEAAGVKEGAAGEDIAKQLGIRYDGIQKGYADVPTKMQFTDPKTGTTFYANTLEEAQAKIIEKGKLFAEGVEVPPVKPPEPPAGVIPPKAPISVQPSPISPPPNGIDDALAQAKVIVQRDKPGLLTRIVSRTPGLKQIQRQLHPAVGMKDNILEGWIGQGHMQATVSNALHSELIPTINKLDAAFGKNATNGVKLAVRFTGTAAEKVPFTGTLYDIMQRPHLYGLSTEQRALLQTIQDSKGGLLNKYRDLYQLDIGEFPTPQGAVHLPNVDKTKTAIETAGSEKALLRRGRAKERFYDTGADRYLHDKALADKGLLKPEDVFQPNLNVGALLDADNEVLATMAGRNVFKTGLGGKTKLELMQTTHPDLYAKMTALKKRLISLQGTGGRLNEKQQGVISDFLNSAYSDDDLTQLAADIMPTLTRGKNIGKDILDINKEITGIKAQIAGLQPAWRTANPRGNVLVQEGGLYRYFPVEDAKTIKRLTKVSESRWLRYVDEVRATAFGGDLSPATIQGLNAWFADPVGITETIGKEMGAAVADRKLLRAFTAEALAADVRASPESWNRFTMATGLDPLGNYQRAEFGTGFVSKIPKVGAKWEAANDALYRGLVKIQKDAFDPIYETGIKMGLTPEQSAAIAADDVTKLIPHYSYRRLGMSAAEATRYRGLLTSVSFLTQPIAFVGDAAKGIIKLGTLQKLTPSEVYAVKRVMTLVATVSSISAVSGAAYAYNNKKDPAQAALAAVTPGGPYFWSLVLPNGDRIGLGGPIRSFLNALAPRAVKGYDVPLPLAGFYRYGTNKLHPAISTAIDEIRDKDYYGKQIRTGKFPINVLQGLEYAIENTLPLTAGTVLEKIRRGETKEMPGAVISQFGGVNLIPEDKVYNLERGEWKSDIKTYLDIPPDVVERKEKKVPYTREQYRERHPDVDAKLFISGQVSSIQTIAALNRVKKLLKENNLDPMNITVVKKWTPEENARRQKIGLKDTLTDTLIKQLLKEQK